MQDIFTKSRAMMVEKAKLYAAADRSDPFTLARAKAHIRAGICDSKPDGAPGHYDAEVTHEVRRFINSRGEATEHSVEVYHSLKRV